MKLRMELGESGYDIVIKRGVLGRAGLLTDLSGRVLVLTDGGVPARHVKKLLGQCGTPSVLALPVGEANKNPAALHAVAERLEAGRFGQGDLIAGIGGGIVCDAAGFAAACYRGGLPLCLFPTTTSAQLDAAIGGRRVLNAGGALSNLRLSCHPRLVAIDPDALSTLPRRVYAAGMVQAVKIGLVAGRELFETLEKSCEAPGRAAIERMIYLCAREKTALAGRQSGGESPLLDFGATLGLALAAEAPSLLYGEALALGMLPMLESPALLRRVRALYGKLGLPAAAPCAAAGLLRRIKESGAPGPRRVVRVKAPGQGEAGLMDEDELRRLAEAFCRELCAG